MGDTQSDPAPTTADPAEIDRFAATAAQWWDAEGAYRALHRINPLRLSFIRAHACRHFARAERALTPLADLTVVDIGCGGGLLTEPLARLGADVRGIDATPESVAVAAEHGRQAGLGIQYLCTTAEQLAQEPARFDIVLTMEIVEHVADAQAFLAVCGELVRPGGLLFAATLNRTAAAFIKAIVAGEWILGWVPRGTHDWNRFVQPEELKRGLAGAGVTVTDMTGVIYSPVTGRWSLDKRDLAVNYMCVGVKG